MQSDSLSSVTVLYISIIGVFAGTMMGITNTIATLPGFIGPSVVGALTYKNVSTLKLQYTTEPVSSSHITLLKITKKLVPDL